MDFEFDPEKAAANPINYEGVTFEEAKAVLLDPYALTQEDREGRGQVLPFACIVKNKRTPTLFVGRKTKAKPASAKQEVSFKSV